MNAKILPATSGLQWLSSAYLIYRRNPIFLVLMTFSFWAAILVLEIFPLIGPLFSAIVTPALLVSVMNVCRDLDLGRPTAPGALFSGFRRNRKTLLILGALRIVRLLAILAVVSLIDGGEMLRLLAQIRPGSQLTQEQFAVFHTLFYVLPLFLPVFMAFWFAHMLAAWSGLNTVKSLFFSLVACWRNLWAFIVYLLALALLIFVLPIAAILLLSLFMPAPLAGTVISIPLMFMFMPVVFASFYVSFRDVFSPEDLP